MADSVKNMVGVPTMGGIGDAFKDFGVGALGGLVFLLAYRIFGGLGMLAAPLLAGSMIKGDRGKVIATIAGFALFAFGMLGTTQASSSGASEDVM
ncbi:MAG: hypothetical protein A2Y89_03100 [Chloroflexi bacterium RBG_13_51_18]|nr:MAG: hypothetical protein A2Y89_03100 [Chloroflexi bacterium RBG_13_51_18]